MQYSAPSVEINGVDTFQVSRHPGSQQAQVGVISTFCIPDNQQIHAADGRPEPSSAVFNRVVVVVIRGAVVVEIAALADPEIDAIQNE